MRRLALGALVAAVLASLMTACSFGGGGARVYKADFSRAIQVFPAVKVRVLGVGVGVVTDVRNVRNAVEVTFKVTDPSVQIPANVQAAVVPMSLLGERYIQLFPAYTHGPTLASGSTIPLSRTAVPAEPDELLRSLQNYLGGLDPKTVTAFIQSAAQNLQGTGSDLNRLIHYGSDVIATLSAKRDDLAQLITEFNKLTLALSTRQNGIAELIQNYDSLASTINANRAALEGTISGLNAAASQLASLLVAHQATLKPDVETLTRTGRTLSRNIDAFATTGHWATMLFLAASRAVDYQHGWLRLGNQGQELGALILMRLEERLMEICLVSGAPVCTTPGFWAVHVPQLFCYLPQGCGKSKVSAVSAMSDAVSSVPKMNQTLLAAAHKKHTSIAQLLQQMLDSTVGNPSAWSWVVQ